MPCRGRAGRAISKFLRVQTDSTSGDGAAPFGHACPRCGAPMVMLTAPNGPHAGQPIWSCSTYPKCRGTVTVEEDPPALAAERVAPAAGGSEQAEIEGRKRRRAERIRQTWPVAVGLTLVAILMAYLLTQAIPSPAPL